jgi:putative transcriptional regulator
VFPEYDVKPTAIRNNIKSFRVEFGMTQQQLGNKVGLTRQSIIAIEAGKYSPSLETAFRIAKVFGVPLEALFRYDPSDSFTD